MLAHLNIHNVGLIEQCQVDFKSGFTIITGETGAGKSMLIDALSLGLGSRADTSLIRHGAENASVEVRFQLTDDHPVVKILAEMGLELEEGELFMRRQLSREKSRAFINGTQVTQGQLQTVGGKLVDIHGQYDGQLILKPVNHVQMLDRFGGLEGQRSAVQQSYQKWRHVYNELLDAQNRIKNQADEEILLTAYIDELEKMDITTGEEQALSQERKLLMSSEKVVKSLSEALNILSGEDSDVSSLLSHADGVLSPLSDLSDEMKQLCERFSSVAIEVGDLVGEIESLGSDYEANPQRLQEVDDRLFTLKDLAKKHNCAVDDLPETLAQMQGKLASLSGLKHDLSRLEQEVLKERAQFEAACNKLSKARDEVAKSLSTAVEKSLKFLEMPQTQFKAQLELLPSEDWGEKGAERVEFMVATNKGQPLAPLVKVASGGEVSRLMLALKQVFYKNIAPTTLVFDEIDTGVGGHVAESMGLAMKDLSSQHQVFSITHLAQVASKGHRHVKIMKKTEGDSTKTTLVELNSDDRLDELSRMISGKEVTAEATAAAAKMLAS
ncbi:MAG: DNA repair protein RecN [Magnetococcales bacterium]|nr:DNA repair protein RecN [Magnetococcales bacterium]|tara:strand:- start:63658 stop:65319 length:1662 start_codon:yes stop_codon:yes gene_type:complete